MMIRSSIGAVVLGAILIMIAGQSSADDRVAPLEYPEAPRSETVDDYHGTQGRRPVPAARGPGLAGDPRLGRGREPGHLRASSNRSPQRDAIRKRLTELWDYEKYSAPSQRRAAGTSTRTTRACRTRASSTRPNRSTAEAERPARPEHALGRRHGRALAGHAVSHDGRSARLRHRRGRLRLERVEGPRRRHRRRTARPPQVDQVLGRRVDPGRQGLLLRPVPRAQAGRGPEGGELPPEALLSTASARPRPTTAWSGRTRPQGMASCPQRHRRRPVPDPDRLEKGTDDKYRVLYRPLDQPDAKPVHLVDDFDAEYTFIDNDGPVFWFKTNKDAPRGKVDRHRHPQARARRTGSS